LISIGHSHYAYSLFVDRTTTALRFISASDGSEVTYDIPFPGEKPIALRLAYSAGGHLLTVEIEGRRVIAQPIEMLVAAPAEIKAGDDPGSVRRSAARFTGKIQILRRDFR
jgi:hypothetical protein